jgi:predicted Zn-dependent protease
MLYWSIKANEKLALQALDRFQHIAPDSAKTHLLLGDMDRQRQHYDEAILEYKQALTMVPNDPAALQGLASAYLLNDKYDDTVTTAASALAQRPRDPELNLLMGEALVAQRKYEQAEAFLNKSLSVKPQQLPHVHALLGKVYAATGRTSEAIANLKLGLEADEDGSIHYQLARLYRQVGDLSEASEAMEQSKALLAARRVRATVALQDTPPPDEP